MLIDENSAHKPPKERKSAKTSTSKKANGGSKKQPKNSASVPELGTNRQIPTNILFKILNFYLMFKTNFTKDPSFKLQVKFNRI